MIRLLIPVFLVLTCSCATTGEISRDDVRRFVESVDRSFQDRDVSAIGDHLADSANIDVEINGQKHTYSKERYLAILEVNWKKADDYSYKKITSDIDIEGPESAVVREEILETMVVGSVQYVIHSSVTANVKLLNGKLVATALSSVSEIQNN